MAIIPITPDFFETLSVVAHPSRNFISGSKSGITGSVKVFGRISKVEKEAQALSPFQEGAFDGYTLEGFRSEWIDTTRGYVASGTSAPITASNVQFLAEKYMELVSSQTLSSRKAKQVEVTRFEPSVKLTSDTLRKNIVRTVLFPWYRINYPALQWAVTNYNTLNFVTSSDLPGNTALIYPAPSSSLTGETVYRPTGPFTFDFYINPRYVNDGTINEAGDYETGTVIHMSSSYAVSLLTGSSRGVNEKPDKFRLMLQLSHSADIPPSTFGPIPAIHQPSDKVLTSTAGPEFRDDLVFLSSNNSLEYNKWHHIGIRWGGLNTNQGTGSFVIDGIVDSYFVIPSASIIPQAFGDPQGDPDALFVGNFYDGQNLVEEGSPSKINLIAQFFNSNAAATEGVTDFNNGAFSIDPPVYSLNHPLSAEVHDLKIFNSYRDIDQLAATSVAGPELEKHLLFYVPPFFVKETRPREVLQTPFQSYTAQTDDPFNVALSFGVAGHLLNLENFTREFVKKEYPRLLNLTASTIDTTTEYQSADTYLFATGSVRKRNLSILPNDNGRFRPNFQLLATGTYASHPGSGSLLDKYTNDFGTLDFSLISLTDMMPTSSLYPGLVAADAGLPESLETSTGSILGTLAGASPENPGVAPGSVLTIFQRTRDNTSNEIVFFDASNLFYGNEIKQGEYKLVDHNVTGSGGAIKVTLRDNKMGSLYRADCIGSHPTWASVGNLIYEEGIAVVLTPVIPYFGKNKFEVDMKGTQNIHVLEVQVPCPAGKINSSSNPTFKRLKASDYASDANPDFVYVTGLNFHDENLNIIGRANLSQPLIKKDDDKFMFKVKIDF